MPALIQPRQLMSQPMGLATIDWSNPINRGLVYLYSGRTGVVFPVDYQKLDLIGLCYSGAKRIAGKSGLSIDRLGGSVSYGNKFGRTKNIDSGAGQTLFSLASNKYSLPSRNRELSYQLGQYETATCLAPRFGNGADGDVVYGYCSGAAEFGGSFTLLPGDNAIAVRQDTGVEQALFVNGVKDPIVSTSKTEPFYGELYAGQSLAKSPVYVAAVWSRALTDSEICSLSANPWQIFPAA